MHERLQFCLNLPGQRAYALIAGINDEMRNLVIQGIALHVKFVELGRRIGDLQQRPGAVALRAAQQRFDRRAQVNDGAVCAQQIAVF